MFITTVVSVRTFLFPGVSICCSIVDLLDENDVFIISTWDWNKRRFIVVCTTRLGSRTCRQCTRDLESNDAAGKTIIWWPVLYTVKSET